MFDSDHSAVYDSQKILGSLEEYRDHIRFGSMLSFGMQLIQLTRVKTGPTLEFLPLPSSISRQPKRMWSPPSTRFQIQKSKRWSSLLSIEGSSRTHGMTIVCRAALLHRGRGKGFRASISFQYARDVGPTVKVVQQFNKSVEVFHERSELRLSCRMI